MTKLADIIHECESCYVIRVATGFELYRNGATAAVRIGRYGRGFMEQAIADCERRAKECQPIATRRG